MFYIYYFKYITLSYFAFYFNINLKIGFINYLKKLKFYFNNTKTSLILFHKGVKTLLNWFIRLFTYLQYGHFIELLVVGLGYKVSLYKKRKELGFDLNYSHKIFFKKPSTILFRVFKKRFLIFGIDKQEVIHFAKKIRALKSPNIYKGTGVRFKSEKVVLKVGKTR